MKPKVLIKSGAALLLFTWFLSCDTDTGKTVIGVVRHTYEDYPCHGNIVIDVNGKTDTLKQLYYCGDSTRAVYKNAKPGDTIIRDDRNKTFVLYNKAKHMTFKYPRTYN